jgi:hypothetical protein
MKIVILILFISLGCWADPETQEAAKKTRELMLTPEGRKEIVNTPQGKNAEQQIKNLSGGNTAAEQEIWELAAELLPIMAAKGDNDPAKMLEYLDQMKKDPAKFAAQFPPEQQQKLKRIAEKLKGKTKP